VDISPPAVTPASRLLSSASPEAVPIRRHWPRGPAPPSRRRHRRQKSPRPPLPRRPRTDRLGHPAAEAAEGHPVWRRCWRCRSRPALDCCCGEGGGAERARSKLRSKKQKQCSTGSSSDENATIEPRESEHTPRLGLSPHRIHTLLRLPGTMKKQQHGGKLPSLSDLAQLWVEGR